MLCSRTLPSYAGDSSLTPSSESLLGNKRTIITGNFPLSRVGSSPGLTTAVGPLEERLRGFHYRSPSIQSSGGIESLMRMDLLLPGNCTPSSRTKAKNIEIIGEAANDDDLETETANFLNQHTSFNNTSSIQKLREERFYVKRTDKDESDLSANSRKDVLKPPDLSKVSNEYRYSGLYGSASSLDVSLEENGLNGFSTHQKSNEYKVECSSISKQLSLMEKQLNSQEIHISDLQKRVMEISR